MITWATLLTLVGCFLAGHTVLGLAGLLGARRARGPLERHATAVLVGAALATTVLMHVVIAAGPITPAIARGVFAVLAVPGLWFALRPGTAPHPEPPPDRIPAWGWLPMLLLLAFGAFAVFSAATMPMHIFDTVYHFSYKAKLIYHEGFGTDAWTDVDGLVGRIITHPDYSPGLAVLNALVGWVGGRFDEDAFRALCGVFVVVPAIWLWVGLRPRSWAAAFSGSFLWVSLPILYYTKLPNNATWEGSIWAFLFGMSSAKERYPEFTFGPADGQILDGGADLAVGAFFFGALIHLYRLLPASRLASDRTDVVLGGLLLGAAMLAKNEGLALTAVLVLAFLLALAAARLAGTRREVTVAPSVNPLAGLAGTVTLAVLTTTGWLAIRGDIPSIDEDYPSRMTVANLLDHSHRWLGDETEPGVLQGFWDVYSHVLRWNLVWPLFFATLLWALARPREFLAHPALIAVLTLLGGSLLYALILLVTPWHLGVLYGTVIPGRLLVHLTPVMLFATVSLLWRFPPAPAPPPAPSEAA